jgi:hypothetical protein
MKLANVSTTGFRAGAPPALSQPGPAQPLIRASAASSATTARCGRAISLPPVQVVWPGSCASKQPHTIPATPGRSRETQG